MEDTTLDDTAADDSEAPARVAPHSLAARIAHWGFLVVFAYALSKQLDEVEELEDAALLEAEMIFASVFLLLVIARFLFMRLTRPTVLGEDAPLHVRRLVRAVHLGLYLCLGGIAATGLAIGALYGADVKTGFALDAALVAHELFVISTYWLIALHVAGAVYHRRRRDGIWDAMVPFWREEKASGDDQEALVRR